MFLGETDAAVVPELDRRLGEAFASYRPLAIRVSDLGAFPPGGRRRVIWAGVDADGDLAGVQAAVKEAVAKATGEKVSKKKAKPYHPHVTVARCDPPWKRAFATSPTTP